MASSISEDYKEFLFARGLRDQTVRNYSAKLRFAVAWADSHNCDLTAPKPSVMREMADELPNSHGSRRHLRTALVYYWQMTNVDGCPEAIVVPRVPPPKPRWIGFAEADALASVARRYWPAGCVILLPLYAGFRRAEVAWCSWEWFDRRWEWATITGKGGKTRHVPIHPDLRAWLRPNAGTGYLFPGGRGPHITTTTVNNWFDRIALEARVEATPHQLRHTFAQTLYQGTGDVHLVQELLGHSKVETTLRYVGATAGQKQAAIQAMRTFGGPSRAAK